MQAQEIELKTATFAGGCFWCLEADFAKLPGVVEVCSGYTGGQLVNPTYEQVCSGQSGHVEAVRLMYRPDLVSYEQLLDYFWRHIDPADAGGQFADRGPQYRTAIFYHDENQRQLAEASKAERKRLGTIATLIRPAEAFYAAEAYHQAYYLKQPARYSDYRRASGREEFLRRNCASCAAPAAGDAPAELTELERRVIWQSGTEPPFDNAYWDNHRPGIYLDRVSGHPLFASVDKFDSGSGWPSFTKPLDGAELEERLDASHGMLRTEVRARLSGAHLGHVFDDGPAPTGLRYCLNSASLRFVDFEDLDAAGLGDYLGLFKAESS